MVASRTVARLSSYRRILGELCAQGVEYVHSHRLAVLSGASAAQVRRDLMAVGCNGRPKDGYNVCELWEKLVNFVTGPGEHRLALVGVGHLGQALLSYFVGGRSHLMITAAFDVDEKKAGCVIHGCRCYAFSELEAVMAREGIRLGLIAVPAPAAQAVADALVAAGVVGLLNFAPTVLHVPSGVYVESVDITTSLEKLAFFSKELR